MKQANEDEALLLSLASFVVQVVGVIAFFSLFFQLVSNQTGGRTSQRDSNVTKHRRGRGKRRELDMKTQRPTPNTSPAIFPAGPVRLPQELAEEIIDHLRDDMQTLKACALTTRKWLSRSRIHLHRLLIIRPGGNDPYKLRFYPNVLNYVRHIVVQGSLGSEIVHSALNGRSDIHTLELEGNQALDTSVSTVDDADIPFFPELRTLCLYSTYFQTCEQMFKALNKFRFLTTLMADFSDHQFAWIDPGDNSYQARLSIQRLHLRMRSMAPILNRPPRSGALLRAAGKALQHLSVNVLSHGQYTALLETLDLSENTSLELLEVALVWTLTRLSWAESRDSGRPATSLLAQIHSHSLHTLVFHIHIPSNIREPRWLGRFNLSMFDFFAQPAVDGSMVSATAERVCACAAKLRSITLDLVFEQCLPAHEFAEIELNVRQQLPMLRNRGMLHVQQSKSSADNRALFLKYDQ